MKVTRSVFTALTISIALLAFASLAQAQAARTFVSGVGNDADPCSRTAPCRTFAGAISKTLTNGEIDVLDVGSYGSVTITKSITIDGGGMFAGSTASSTTGITINLNAGTTSDPQQRVTIRNLSINGVGTCVAPCSGTNTGLRGITIVNPSANAANSTVVIQKVVVQNFTQQGIRDNRTSQGGKLFVEDTIINNCGSSGGANGSGVLVLGGNQTIRAVFKNVSFIDNGNAGLAVSTNSLVTARDCVAMGNAGAGFFVDSAGAASELTLENCVSSSNATGVSSGAGAASAVLSNTVVTDNTSNGLAFAGGSIFTFGNNKLFGNAGVQTGMTAAVPGVQ